MLILETKIPQGVKEDSLVFLFRKMPRVEDVIHRLSTIRTEFLDLLSRHRQLLIGFLGFKNAPTTLLQPSRKVDGQ